MAQRSVAVETLTPDILVSRRRSISLVSRLGEQLAAELRYIKAVPKRVPDAGWSSWISRRSADGLLEIRAHHSSLATAAAFKMHSARPLHKLGIELRNCLASEQSGRLETFLKWFGLLQLLQNRHVVKICPVN